MGLKKRNGIAICVLALGATLASTPVKVDASTAVSGRICVCGSRTCHVVEREEIVHGVCLDSNGNGRVIDDYLVETMECGNVYCDTLHVDENHDFISYDGCDFTPVKGKAVLTELILDPNGEADDILLRIDFPMTDASSGK